MNTSTESSATSDSLDRTIREEGAQILKEQARIDLGMRAVALESARRGMKWEHDMIEGKETDTADDSMLVLGDYNVNQEPSKKDNTAEIVSALAPLVSTGAKAATGVNPWVAAALALTTLVSGGAIASQFLGSKPAETGADADTQYSIELVEPISE